MNGLEIRNHSYTEFKLTFTETFVEVSSASTVSLPDKYKVFLVPGILRQLRLSSILRTTKNLFNEH